MDKDMDKDERKFLSRPITNLCNLSITSEAFPDSCKVAKRKTPYKRGSLIQLYNYRPTYLLLITSEGKEKVILDQTSTFLNCKNFLQT